MGEFIEAGYVPIGLLVLPPTERIDDYLDACGVLRWPAETWGSCRSIEESKRFIAQVAEGLAPSNYHLRHFPISTDDPNSMLAEQPNSGHEPTRTGRSKD
jgi:hypothetical protein